MRYLRSLDDKFMISLPTDKSGYLGRECPNADCRGYFKIMPGTGISGVITCHCPYCGHVADHSKFHTADQTEYAKSVAIREIMGAVTKDLKDLEFEIKPKGPFGIGMSMKVQPGPLHPIHWYKEEALETHVECSSCILQYAIFGVFAFCPDCGKHNSLQILEKNVELVSKMLDMAASAEAELAGRLVENALEDCVSALDGFGREICRVHSKASADPDGMKKVSFQNLEGARQSVAALFKLDLAAGLIIDEWNAAVLAFQKRHLLAHKMGVMDADYVRKSGDSRAVVGRKVNVDAAEVRKLSQIISKLGQYICKAMGSEQCGD